MCLVMVTPGRPSLNVSCVPMLLVEAVWFFIFEICFWGVITLTSWAVIANFSMLKYAAPNMTAMTVETPAHATKLVQFFCYLLSICWNHISVWKSLNHIWNDFPWPLQFSSHGLCLWCECFEVQTLHSSECCQLQILTTSLEEKCFFCQEYIVSLHYWILNSWAEFLNYYFFDIVMQ